MNKHAAEANKARRKSAAVIPSLGTLVGVVGAVTRSAAENEDEGHDEKYDDRAELHQRDPDLLLDVAKHAEDVDEDEEEGESGDPDGDVDVGAPI